jgi:hypothetical protein
MLAMMKASNRESGVNEEDEAIVGSDNRVLISHKRV